MPTLDKTASKAPSKINLTFFPPKSLSPKISQLSSSLNFTIVPTLSLLLDGIAYALDSGKDSKTLEAEFTKPFGQESDYATTS